MIPLRDTLPRRTVPVVNTLLVLLNVFGFVLQLAAGADVGVFIQTFGFVPARLFHPELAAGIPNPGALIPFVSSMFLHGGLLHLVGNMLYLWVFGDNVEDALGHGRYLFFYLCCGASATLLHAATAAESTVPLVGASGAIAGVLGAYFLFFPRSRVVTLVPIFFLFPVVEVRAGVFLAIWFVMQVWMGSTESLRALAGQGAGVAWWAHVGGFVAGGALGLLLRRRDRRG